VTRHAKASSVGSTQGQGSRSGSFVRGAGATRGHSSDANGSGALAHRGRLATFSFVAALLALALFASSALASKQVISDFGNPAGSGSFGGELNNPRDVAVNETGVGPANAGDTYVADEGNNRIERFDSAGNFLSAWGKDTIAATVNERQRVIVEASEGTYTLSFNGSTTPPIEFSTPYYILQEKLTALPSIGEGNVEVSGEGKVTNPLVVTFKGTLGGTDQPTLTADTSQLTGTVEISTIANGTSTTGDTGSGFEICTVAAECQAGTPSGENGALSNPQSVAVDQDTGNVYVSDRGNRRVAEYDGEGNFIRSFGFDVAESGPGDTGTEYEVCNEEDGDVCKEGIAGSGVGQYGEGFAERGFGIAVSPADTNASTGTVYLADSGNRRVDTFDLDGTNPASFGSSANFGEEQPRSVAVDSRGIVYASDSNNNGDIQRYDSKNVDGGGAVFLAPIVPPNNERQEITFSGFGNGDNFTLTCPNGTSTEELTYVEGEVGFRVIRNGLEEACGAKNVSVAGEPPNVTVTFEGTLGGADQPQMTCTSLGAGNCTVTTTSEGHPGPLLTGSTFGLAVSPTGSALYVLRAPNEGSTVVQQFGPAHEPGLSAPPTVVDDTHGAAAELGSNSSSFWLRGFGFDSASGRLYISVNGDPDSFEFTGHPGLLPYAHRVYVLDEDSLPSPTVSTPSVTGTATRSATFHSEVDPKGGLVSCKFQYSTDETTWTDVNVPGCGVLNQSGGTQDISKFVTGLAPNTHYFVRLQVTRPYFSGFTPVTSAAQGFTTASGPPLISKAKAAAVDEHSVRVTALIDPSHSPTTYVVEYGTSTSLGSSTEPVSVGAGTEPIEVSPVIGGLAPATQYYFKVVATNLVNSAVSENLSVTTFPATPSFGSCPNERFRTGPSAKLPDCRAYEQATPADKTGSDVNGSTFSVQASSSGDAITSFAFAGFPGPESFAGTNVLMSRFDGGKWSTAGLSNPYSYGNFDATKAWTSDLRLSFGTPRHTEAGGSRALVMRDSVDGSRTVLIPQGVGFGEGAFALGGAFDDDSKVVFEANGSVPVTSGPAPTSTERNIYLYDRDTRELVLVGVLPDSACASPPCVPTDGSEFPPAFGGFLQEGHVVTPDGDVYFTDSSGKLYLRRDATGPGATTVLVSASHKTEGGGPGGVATNSPQPAAFMGAIPDGSKSFLTSAEELTNDANTGPEPFLTPSIGRANSDGSGVQRGFISTKAKWTAVDSGHVYWTNTEAGTIGRADIGGANPEPSFITGLEKPEGIAVDAGHLYWAEARDHQEGHGTIGRSTLAGTSVEKEFIAGASDPRGVAVNSEFVYWTNGATNYIGRATIAGASPEQGFRYTESPWGIAANATNLYVIAGNGGYIYEYKADGEFANFAYLAEEARGLAIDSSHVYWSDFKKAVIGRFNLDLGNANPEFIPSVYGVVGLAVDAGHIYWATNPSGLPPSPGSDLYRYDRESDELVDLVPDDSDPIGAQVIGVLGYSNDGNSVYFAANADLDGAGPAASGDCSPGYTEHGSCSVYLWQAEGTGGCATTDGCISFIFRSEAGSGSSSLNWWGGPTPGGGADMKVSRVSSDGSTLVFESGRKLTAYDNRGTPEFYRYDAGSGQFTCLTCDPTGAPPVGAPGLKNADLFHAPTSYLTYRAQIFLSRNLSPDGNRFFFQSTDKLVPADVNGEVTCSTREQEVGSGGSCLDVYEWEAPGDGTCTEGGSAYSPANGGCIYLLSTGTGPYPSYLADVSESGDVAFIFSRQQLVPADEDTQEDLYAVKVDGGLAAQHEARPAACEGDACRGASSQPSNAPGAGSGVFEGPGNPKQSTNQTRCPKGKRTVHSKGKVRCVAKKHKKAHKHKSKAHKRAANTNRRASR
jgi:virginiamycin B lyase